jgi:ADP-ribose pyrophosphatase YjhB (NUDIX family)
MAEFHKQIPQGDNRERLVCADCGHVAYENPKIVTGAVVVHGGQVLLCRRDIQPRRGFWTLPAGYMELGETVAEAARREASEEACADITLEGILAVYSISRLGQVQIFYQARFTAPHHAPLFAVGEESQEVRLFAWDDIPWQDLAFPTVHWALTAWRGLDGALPGVPAGNPPEDARGTSHLPHEHG